jgi:hypothetical protein
MSEDTATPKPVTVVSRTAALLSFAGGARVPPRSPQPRRRGEGSGNPGNASLGTWRREGGRDLCQEGPEVRASPRAPAPCRVRD